MPHMWLACYQASRSKITGQTTKQLKIENKVVQNNLCQRTKQANGQNKKLKKIENKTARTQETMLREKSKGPKKEMNVAGKEKEKMPATRASPTEDKLRKKEQKKKEDRTLPTLVR